MQAFSTIACWLSQRAKQMGKIFLSQKSNKVREAFIRDPFSRAIFTGPTRTRHFEISQFWRRKNPIMHWVVFNFISQISSRSTVQFKWQNFPWWYLDLAHAHHLCFCLIPTLSAWNYAKLKYGNIVFKWLTHSGRAVNSYAHVCWVPSPANL